MSEPAIFALVRNGKTRYFADRWANALLRREVMWGPEDFEAWVLQFEPVEAWDEDCEGGAVVDFDRRALAWSSDTSSYQVPRVLDVYRKMLAAAWPEFEVTHVAGGNAGMVRYLRGTDNVSEAGLVVLDADKEHEVRESRPETVDEAKRYVADDEDGEELDTDAVRAWLTIVDADRRTQQRELQQLSLDLLMAKPEALEALAALEPAAIPREVVVSEGLWINPSERAMGIWGSPELIASVKKYSECWNGWKLTLLNRGYDDQCAVAGMQGMPMSNADAAAKVVPLILSTQQFDAEVMLKAIGDGLKRFANKAVGCLLLVLCLPLVIFGLVSGNWQPVLITMVATVLIALAAYQLLVYRFKRMVRRRLSQGSEERPRPVVAGPHDEAARRERIDEILQRAELPRLAEVEPLFSGKSGLELLAES
ncbi:MAG: hypothetical protein WD845_11520 [Pirellulales bacterium]